MTKSKRIAPPNSLILVSDFGGGEIPASMNQSLIAATDSCIAVGTRAEDDGESEISLGRADTIDVSYEPVFVGRIKTPSRRVAVRTVLGDVLLEMDSLTTETIVRIWVNDSTEPDQIAIGIV